ncbi:hypothetical protein M8494_27745 [Serratia ureilytica]
MSEAGADAAFRHLRYPAAILELKLRHCQAGRGQDPAVSRMSWRKSAISCRRCWRPSAS